MLLSLPPPTAQPPTARNYPAHDINDVQAENPHFRLSTFTQMTSKRAPNWTKSKKDYLKEQIRDGSVLENLGVIMKSRGLRKYRL